jgi:hypothetical protein
MGVRVKKAKTNILLLQVSVYCSPLGFDGLVPSAQCRMTEYIASLLGSLSRTLSSQLSQRMRKKMEKESREYRQRQDVEFDYFLSYLSAMEPETRRAVWLSQPDSQHMLKFWICDVLIDNVGDETQLLDAHFHALDQTLVAWKGGDRTIFVSPPLLWGIGVVVMDVFKRSGRYTSLDRFLQYMFRWEDNTLRETFRGVLVVWGEESSTTTGDGLLSAIYPDEPSPEACITRFLERNLREKMLRDLDSLEEDGANRRIVGMYGRVKGLQLLEQALCESGVYMRETFKRQARPIETVPTSGSETNVDIGNES